MRTLILTFHGAGPIAKPIGPNEFACWLDQEFLEAVLDLVCGHPHVQLTIDDGNSSDVDVILPALLQRKLRATFFICSARLDQPAYLSRHQVHELRAHNMEIGSHGVAHVPWRGLPAAQLATELNSSRRTLEDLCGTLVDVAACPFGAYDRRVGTALLRAGYRQAYTCDGGTCPDGDWIRPRNTVMRSMTLKEIQHLINRGPGTWAQFLITVKRIIKRLR
jgi:peptidoglycan/xylan/chitin deacetylase (PgdA/CDA1 family)